MRKPSKRRVREIRFQVIIEIIMLVILFFCFVPIFMMLIMSVKTGWEITYDFFALPKAWAWYNYKDAFSILSQNMWNTLFVVSVAVVLTLVLSMLGGYVFATMKFPGKEFLYMALLALMMLPGVLTLASNYNLMLEYKMNNTWWALILPWISGGQVMGIILCRNSIEALPSDLFEAAKIEGCGEINGMLKIALPLSRSILATVAVLQLNGYYNDFIWPLMVIESNSKQVITVAVRIFTAAQGTVNVGAMFAGYTIATLPLLLLFLFTSRLYMEGLTSGAVKG